MTYTPEQRREFYGAVEAALERMGVDYEIHALSDSDDVDHEEYHFTNVDGGGRLFPVLLPASEAAMAEAASLVEGGVQAWRARGGTRPYQVVLCGEGWTAELADQLQEFLARRLPPDSAVMVKTLNQFIGGAA